LLSFFGGEAATQVENFQLKQSLIAVGSGGFWGAGYAQAGSSSVSSRLATTTSSPARSARNGGSSACVVLVGLFACYAWLGMRIARQARTPFLQLVAVGLTVTTVITAFVHIGVVIGLLPTTGLTLPFVSYGPLEPAPVVPDDRHPREHRKPARARRGKRRHEPSLGQRLVLVVFTGGGTGGHLYPALAVARALVRQRPDVEPFFVGARRGIERTVLPGTGFPHVLLDFTRCTAARRGRAG
jgi:hypothetical protein